MTPRLASSRPSRPARCAAANRPGDDMIHEAAAIVTASGLGILGTRGTRGVLGTHSAPDAHRTRSSRRAFDTRGALGSARPASTCLARMCTSIDGMSIFTGHTS